MPKQRWTPADAPSQRGRVAVVTGANSGIGLETARQLAGLGARVVLACRNPDAAARARDDIAATVTGAQLEIVRLDLSDLSSVRECADELLAEHPSIDLLINNAGLMRQRRELTADGFEMDFGTNFLGHFALTGRLLPLLTAAEAGRIVTVGSKVYKAGVIDFDDLTMERGFSTARAYSRAKLAELVFAVELQRRLERRPGRSPISVAAHPGATQSGVMRDQAVLGWLFTTPSLRWIRRTFIMEAPDGAAVTLRAATDPAVLGGQYYGPHGVFGFSGPPAQEVLTEKATDPVLGEKLWGTAEKLTGVSYEL
ncbi:SDR family NAD(P)-dependent oxidoreductase [Gordonia desulfuricans]|uniref:SDR family NAD(P)-dependent oxidoreductase n=1 Tax=Gordonia desulfuricans TaxID=89051 RepID=A0A7K3LJ35_9ACTN|nr:MULTISPECIES: oxidoreductase [Gordonia]EMP10747.2 short-chain dehydrogenase [Gordonia sp. NB41Y]NDK88183.1 SDR family NAD(P)-dependent oxidoreductase [Gordonia desulfuricans]WLP89156.1 oxidoreductase [Gordonia sp. NB41Y]